MNSGMFEAQYPGLWLRLHPGLDKLQTINLRSSPLKLRHVQLRFEDFLLEAKLHMAPRT
jgi:hypothetical protein